MFLLPTYLSSSTPVSVAHAEYRYRSIVSIPRTQSTNSVLAMTYGVFGLLAFPILGFVAFVAAAISGHASRYRSYAFLAGLVVAYCFAEWWRVWVFNTGLIGFLVLAVAFWGLVGAKADHVDGRPVDAAHATSPRVTSVPGEDLRELLGRPEPLRRTPASAASAPPRARARSRLSRSPRSNRHRFGRSAPRWAGATIGSRQ